MKNRKKSPPRFGELRKNRKKNPKVKFVRRLIELRGSAMRLTFRQFAKRI
jgi:hypothetical protein